MSGLTLALIDEANACSSGNALISNIAGSLAAFAVSHTSTTVEAKNVIDAIATLAGQVINECGGIDQERLS